MANIDNELIKGTILGAIENAIRLEHMEGGAASDYRVGELKHAHATLTRKVYRSDEARTEHWLAQSITDGSDFGTWCIKKSILERAGMSSSHAEEFASKDYKKSK